MLPNVIFVGPTKCGTTWIDTYLRSRDEVVLPVDCKETFFFDKNFDKGVEWYKSHFTEKNGVCIEVAPSLFHKTWALENLKMTCPDAKIVIVFRDPYDRAISHYFHYRKQGVPSMPIGQMAQQHPDIVEAGLFNKYSQMWEEAFPGNVYFMPYALLKSNPDEFCKKLCQIIGIEPDFSLPSDLSNRSVNSASLPRSALLALMTRRGAEMARRMGAHKLVNLMRNTPLKKMAFSGGGDVDSERNAVKLDIVNLEPYLGRDLAEFQSIFAAKLT